MKLIVAGGRDFDDYALVYRLLDKLLLEEPELEIISGLAKGADTIGKDWADLYEVKCHKFPADWDNIDVPGAVIKYHPSGKPYNAAAGNARNRQMAEFGDALLAFWSIPASKGTGHMIDLAYERGLRVAIVRYKVTP